MRGVGFLLAQRAPISASVYPDIVSWDVEFDEAVFEWLTGLEEASFVQVRAAINVLRDRGPQLGRPLVDTVVGSRHKNMRSAIPTADDRYDAHLEALGKRADGDAGGGEER